MSTLNQYAGPSGESLSLSTSQAYTSKYAEGVRVAAVVVAYAAPATLSLSISRKRGTQSRLLRVLAIEDGSTIRYEPAALWLRPGDTLVLDNSVEAAATVELDFVYN